MDDLVSIIMPSYNTSPYISKSIESVLEQTYKTWELIIVDDCSTDDTETIVRRYSDNRIQFYINPSNMGAAMSRNYALRQAKGRWIAFLDSDDYWAPEKLEKQIDFMKKNHYSFSYTNYEEVDLNDHYKGTIVSGPKVITHFGMMNYCWPGCLTVMYDVNIVGLLQVEKIAKNNDYAMWLQVSKKANCYLLDEILAFYRRGREGSISTQNYTDLIKWHYKLFHEVNKQGPIQSCFNTMRNIVFGIYKKIRYITHYSQ